MLERSLELTDRIVGMLMVSVPMLVIAFLWVECFGGGDIKLMAICGLLLGSKDILRAAWITLLTAAGYASWLLISKKNRKAEFALGPFICFGVLCVFLDVL